MSEFDFDKIDKSKWKKYRFDQIALSVSERVEPNDTDLEVYVGLEHIDSDSVHIKRTGVPSDVGGTKLRVHPGDVIFGKRRAYQRKAAIATFDGICSAHAMVLRANEKVIDKKLFPFFLHSDYFMHRAIDISVGSLSPTINWGTLKTQEYLLPPKDQQERLAELLWAADEMTERYAFASKKLENVKEYYLNEVFNDPNNIQVSIDEISKCLDNKRVPVKSSDRKEGSIPYYGASGIVDYVSEHIYDEPILLISEDGENINTRNLPIAYEVDGKCWVNNHAHVLKIVKGSRKIISEYFNHADISDFVSGSTRPKINKSTLMEMNIAIPDFSEHDFIERQIKLIDANYQALIKQFEDAHTIQKQLINQIFSA